MALREFAVNLGNDYSDNSDLHSLLTTSGDSLSVENISDLNFNDSELDPSVNEKGSYTQTNCLPCKTCGDKPAMIDNYMGYNIDVVRKRFTPGQLLRMLSHLYYGDRFYLIADTIKI